MNRSMFARIGRATFVCAILCASTSARADEPVLTPPRLSLFTEAEDPRPIEARERASVELEIDVDRDGKVANVRVVTSAGDALDRAAMAAAKSFTFEPATRDGKPVPARIRYGYVFAARAPEAAAQPPEPATGDVQTASIAGVALDRDDGKPLTGANVVVTTDGGATFRTKTDESGAFRVDGIPAGRVHVTVTKDGKVPARLDETLESGTLTEAKLRLEAAPDPEAFEATARVDAPPREVTKRALSREEMTRMPGTRGDPMRAVELLPGVSRPANGGGLPILRGANPYDSQVFVEGVPVPALYHLGGLTSIVHARVLDTVELYPSNFSVRYGRKVGGIIEAKFRDPRTDKLHGIAEVSLLDSSLLVETPIGDKLSVLAAARRSNIDAVFNTASSTADLGVTAAPVYWDYQAIVAFKPTDQDRLRLVSYGSSDRFALVANKPANVDPALRGAFNSTNVFHNVQLQYRHRFHGGSETNAEVTYSRNDGDGAFGRAARFAFATNVIQGRTEWTAVVSPALRVVAGLDVLTTNFDGKYTGVPVPSDEGDPPRTVSSQPQVGIETSAWVLAPAAYVEAGIRPVGRVLLTPGVRADYYDFTNRASVDPRVSARVDVTDATALKAGVGRFTQTPFEAYATPPLGNPDLQLTHAIHASAGVEQKLTEALSVSAEGFGKWIDGIVTSTPGGVAPFYVNSQDGRIFGGELMVRMKPSGRLFGFLSYTLMRSERRDPGQDWRLFDRDQTHIANAAAVYRLGRGWELGASLRYTSGTPFTPVTSATYDATNDLYTPRYGRPMSARNPAFSRLDLRVQKTWTFSKWSLAVYLDVQNVLNQPNREGFNYTYDYRDREGVLGLPILPVLGLRGEL